MLELCSKQKMCWTRIRFIFLILQALMTVLHTWLRLQINHLEWFSKRFVGLFWALVFNLIWTATQITLIGIRPGNCACQIIWNSMVSFAVTNPYIVWRRVRIRKGNTTRMRWCVQTFFKYILYITCNYMLISINKAVLQMKPHVKCQMNSCSQPKKMSYLYKTQMLDQAPANRLLMNYKSAFSLRSRY